MYVASLRGMRRTDVLCVACRTLQDITHVLRPDVYSGLHRAAAGAAAAAAAAVAARDITAACTPPGSYRDRACGLPAGVCSEDCVRSNDEAAALAASAVAATEGLTGPKRTARSREGRRTGGVQGERPGVCGPGKGPGNGAGALPGGLTRPAPASEAATAVLQCVAAGGMGRAPGAPPARSTAELQLKLLARDGCSSSEGGELGADVGCESQYRDVAGVRCALAA